MNRRDYAIHRRERRERRRLHHYAKIGTITDAQFERMLELDEKRDRAERERRGEECGRET